MYSYEGNQGQSYANPHAVTKIIAPSKSLLFKYDQNGNVIGTQDSSGINATLEWNSDNQLTALRRNGASREVFNYGYDSKGIRFVTRSAGTISKYPSQFYNTDGQVAQKHILASGVNVATVKGIGASAELVLLHTDHLGSVRVSSLASSTAPSVDAGIMEVLDYDAFGSVRVDELPQGQTPEQRQYTGHEYDGDTGLVYAQARYYNPAIGRFLSQDPVFLSLGNAQKVEALTGSQLQGVLSDPQGLNSYSYVRNNPLRLVDPNGEWFWDLITGKQSWNDFQVEAGDAANILYNGSNTWRAVMDHPIITGAVVGVVGGLAAVGGAAGVTALNVKYIGGAGTVCVAFCNKVVEQVNRTVPMRDQLLQSATDPNLKSIINELYRPGAKIGDGGTADALRYEMQTGKLLSPAGHLEKVVGRVNQLTRYLGQDNLSVRDRQTAESLLNNLKDAMHSVLQKK